MTMRVRSWPNSSNSCRARVAANLTGAADAVTVRGVERSLRKELEAMLETFVDAAVQREERTEE